MQHYITGCASGWYSSRGKRMKMTFRNIVAMQAASSIGNKIVSTDRGDFVLECRWLGHCRGHAWRLMHGAGMINITERAAAEFLARHPLNADV
jgi:hypothetical protein